MNNVRRCPCQTPGWRRLAILALLAGWAWTLRADSSPAPAPTPPPWQAEVNAAHVLQASLTLVLAKDEAEENARETRMTEAYRQLATKYPDAAPVQLAAGDGLASLGQTEAALRCLRRAQTLEPQSAETADSLGSAFLTAGQVREASAQFQRAVDARPEVAHYHFALANVQYLFRHELLAPPAWPDEQAVLRAALEHFRRAAELAPGDLALAKAYAETFYVFAQPDWTQALAAWEAVLALSGENADFANSNLARVSLRLGRRADAETYLARIKNPAFDAQKRKMLQSTRAAGAGKPSPSPGTRPIRQDSPRM